MLLLRFSTAIWRRVFWGELLRRFLTFRRNSDSGMWLYGITVIAQVVLCSKSF
jgi:hypothetical protein